MSGESKAPELGILFQGMGAVASTVAAGVLAVRRQLAEPIGALSQVGRLDDGTPISDLIDLTPLNRVTFGGWDIFGGTMYDACESAQVLQPSLLHQLKEELAEIVAMPGAFDPAYVRRLNGTHVLPKGRRGWVEAIRDDIRRFKQQHQLERCVLVNCSSTESFRQLAPQHQTLPAFERALDLDDPVISPSMVYAYAALLERVPYANGTPSLAADIPALSQLAWERRVPIAGKDFKTGQTLVKTVIAPMFKARALGLNGWFSTNILGNRDGEVLSDPDNFKTKEQTKLGVLHNILSPQRQPGLYGNIHHEVRINYYRPRGDEKEGWDNIDFFGWLGYPMQMKINLLCRDSILAAPIVLDLALFLDAAQMAERRGEQEWLGFYWKHPVVSDGSEVVHDLFQQQARLHEALRQLGTDLRVRRRSLEAAGAPRVNGIKSVAETSLLPLNGS